MTFGGGGGANDPFWGSATEPETPLEEPLELIGNQLRAAGRVQLGRFRRLTDYVNFLDGFCTLRDVTLLDRSGVATRVTMPELRVRLDDVAILAQRTAQAPPPPSEAGVLVEKVSQRLVLMTRAHLVSGEVHVHAGGSLLHFVDSVDPRFIPMSDVRVRWLDEHDLAGHFPFALVQRSQILGVATEGIGGVRDGDERRQRAGSAGRSAGDADGSADANGSADATDPADARETA